MTDEFLAMFAHDLRTPLNAILGWSQLLRTGHATEEEIAGGLESIERNARLQAQLIDDLMDINRIASGKLRLQADRIELPAAIEAALDIVRPEAVAAEVELVKSIDAAAGPVVGDFGRIRQILRILLSNAIKFSPAGGRITLRLDRHESSLRISVHDEGKGIAADRLPHLFDRSVEAAAIAGRHSGFGLGLAIARHLTELHRGTIDAESAGPGAGSTFTITLPIAAQQQPQAPQSAVTHRPTRTRPLLRGLRVLVVDDDPDARALITRILRDFSADTFAAGSVPEAMKVLEQRRTDILVSDIGMPNQDGFELIRLVRQLASDAGGMVPAIALTAFARPEDRTRSLLSGYQAHVSKPLEPAELVNAVADLARDRLAYA